MLPVVHNGPIFVLCPLEPNVVRGLLQKPLEEAYEAAVGLADLTRATTHFDTPCLMKIQITSA